MAQHTAVSVVSPFNINNDYLLSAVRGTSTYRIDVGLYLRSRAVAQLGVEKLRLRAVGLQRFVWCYCLLVQSLRQTMTQFYSFWFRATAVALVSTNQFVQTIYVIWACSRPTAYLSWGCYPERRRRACNIDDNFIL